VWSQSNSRQQGTQLDRHISYAAFPSYEHPIPGEGRGIFGFQPGIEGIQGSKICLFQLEAIKQ